MIQQVYLAGPIRKEDPQLSYDIGWRQDVRALLFDSVYNPDELTVVDPLAGKRKDAEGNWVIYETASSTATNVIVRSDLMKVDQSDIIFVNLLPFSADRYPCIGTFCEMGAAMAKDKLIVAVTDAYGLLIHPFMDAVTAVFQDIDEAATFTAGLVSALQGAPSRLVAI